VVPGVADRAVVSGPIMVAKLLDTVLYVVLQSAGLAWAPAVNADSRSSTSWPVYDL
jgi:hypothetical protein